MNESREPSGEQVPNEEVSNQSDTQMSRRKFLRITGTGAVTGAIADVLVSDADAAAKKNQKKSPIPTSQNPQIVSVGNRRQSPDVAVKQREIKKLSDGSFYVPPLDTEKNGEGMRGPSLFTVNGYQNTIATIAPPKAFSFVATKGVQVEFYYLIPFTRSIGEISCDGGIVPQPDIYGVSNLSFKVHEATSQPNDNKFLLFEYIGIAEENNISIRPGYLPVETHPSSVTVPATSMLADAQRIVRTVRANTAADRSNNVLVPSNQGGGSVPGGYVGCAAG